MEDESMKFSIIVIGMVALAVLFAGCTSQEQKVDNVVSTSAPVYVDNVMNVSSTQTPTYYDNPVVKLEGNKSYQLTGAEVQGCKIAAYIDNNGTTEMRNAPDNPVGCASNGIGKV
jgi:hypothetical protein